MIVLVATDITGKIDNYRYNNFLVEEKRHTEYNNY